jgi:hypothetical protein
MNDGLIHWTSVPARTVASLTFVVLSSVAIATSSRVQSSKFAR